jgi:hypothetical protein
MATRMTIAKSLLPLVPRTARNCAACLVALLAFVVILRPSLLASVAKDSAQQPSSATAKRSPEIPPLFPVRLNGRFGYMDRTGKIVVTPQFQRAWDFHDGMARVDSATEGHGIIDAAGKATFLRQFSWIGNFSEGLAQVDMWDGSAKAGYIDATGALVIPATWNFYGEPTSNVLSAQFWRKDRNANFSEGLAAVLGPSGKMGYIDKTGKVVIPPQFLFARPFSEGLAAVANDQFAFGYIDAQGKVIIPLVYHNVYPGNFSEGLARVKASGDITFADHQGNPQVVVNTGVYFAGYDFHDGMAKISDNNI